MRGLVFAAGCVLTLVVFLALVQSMLVPRGQRSKVPHSSRALVARAVGAVVNGVTRFALPLLRSYPAQDRWLAAAAPISVLLQLVVYVGLLIVTMGMVIFGVTELSFGDSLYQSGATVTTLGIVEPVNNPSTVACFVAAFLGLVVIAVFIGYLMALYGAYVARESQMARLALLAGEPPWGPEILARAHDLEIPAQDAPDCPSWVGWICDLRMNQAVNPVIGQFRATDSTRHWVIAMLAVTDAAALRLSLSEERADPHAVQLIAESTLAFYTLNRPADRIHNWGLERQIKAAIDGRQPGRPESSGLTEQDWAIGIQALRDVRFPLPDDLDAAREKFLGIRGFYAPHAQALAQRFHAVPAPWSGPRKPAVPTVWPELAEEGSHV